jgi:hypothetical protein
MKQMIMGTPRMVALLAVACSMPAAGRGVADDQAVVTAAANETTAAMVRVDGSMAAGIERLAEAVGGSGPLLETDRWVQIKSALEGLKGKATYLAIDLPYAPRFQARWLMPDHLSDSEVRSIAQSFWPDAVGQPELIGAWRRVALSSDAAGVEGGVHKSLPPVEQERWLAALAATEGYPVQGVAVAPGYVRETFQELQPQLPAAFGGGPAMILIDGVRWLSLGVDPDRFKARLVVQSDSEAAAQALLEYMPQLYQALLRESQLDPASSALVMALLGLLQPSRQGDQVIWSLEKDEQSDAVRGLVSVGLRSVGGAAMMVERRTANTLKQLLLAFHNYESAFGTLPTYGGSKGTELPSQLSWRVHILPFIGEMELYEQFRLDEPWDSPHNIQLLDKMPSFYRPVLPADQQASVPAAHTTFLAPVGERTLFGRDKRIGFRQVTDGLSNTVVLVEVAAAHAQPWTSPEEYRYDPSNPAAKLRVSNGRSTVGLLDGSVQTLPIDMPWEALFSIDGGEVVDWRSAR